jgi:hypothetical protein
MGRLKRKASASKLENSTKKVTTVTTAPPIPSKPLSTPIATTTATMSQAISPTSKVTLFKIDVFQCNGKPLKDIELCSADLENIWKESLLRELSDLSGYTSTKTKNNSEIRIQYQLKHALSIRSIAAEAEFGHERLGANGVEILRCRVVGLGNIRRADIGEKVKITVILPSFDILPEQIIEWLSRYVRVYDGHGYVCCLFSRREFSRH